MQRNFASRFLSDVAPTDSYLTALTLNCAVIRNVLLFIIVMLVAHVDALLAW